MSRDFDKAQEMVVASMEYVKVLGFRIRRTEVQRDDWKQVAQSHADEMIKLRQHVDALKAERNAEGKAHDEYKERNREIFNGNQRLTAELAVIKDERDALRTECDDLRRVFSLVHGSLGIQQGEHIGNAIDALKKERDELATRLRQRIARGDFAEMRLATLAAELETERERHRQTAAVPQSVDVPRTHPVKVGESVRRTTEGSIAPIGTLGRVLVVWSDAYQVELRKGFSTIWAFDDCTPCDPPPEASHITPEGKQTAEGALPQPGDVVRLVRVPTVKDCSAFQDSEQLRLISTQVNTMGKVVGTELCEACACVVDDTGTIKAWPLSCVEVVKGGDK